MAGALTSNPSHKCGELYTRLEREMRSDPPDFRCEIRPAAMCSLIARSHPLLNDHR